MSGWKDGAVLVTGASRGLGAAVARAFAEAGAPVSLCARGAAELERVSEEIRARGGTSFAREADVTDEVAVGAWVDEAEARLGPIGVLVNNASLLGPRLGLAEYPTDAWRAVLEVNLTGTFLTTKAVLPGMLRAGRGVVLNVSSGAAIPPRSHWGAYAISKLAVEGYTRNLARELAGTGVRVHSVDPGAMRTGMRAEAYPEEDPATVKSPEEATGLFLWLASEGGGRTGERWNVDEWLRRERG